MGQDERRLLKALYENYLVSLKKLAAKIGIDYDDIEDVVHDTILTYFDRYPLDWADKQKRAMLVRILYSKRVDIYRRRLHCIEVSIEDSEEEILAVKRLTEMDTLTRVVDNETYQEVRKLINEMRKDWRDVIILRVLDDRPISEVCEILEISGEACRSRIARARKYLKEELKDLGLFVD